jgi:diadenosine tetraphosphate (Ap4A) HIT family hydrolase
MTLESWKQERSQVAARAAELAERGQCPTCYDLETGDLFSSDDRRLFEDERFLVILERYPRMRGHTIVVYKPHREDVSELSDDESGSVMTMCIRTIKALKRALGAEKVYLNSMCDGRPNHLHLQLFPRFAGEAIGSRRFVLARSPIEDVNHTAQLVRPYLSS